MKSGFVFSKMFTQSAYVSLKSSLNNMFTESAKNISLQTQRKFPSKSFGVSTTFGLNSLSEKKNRKKHFYTRGHESACIVIITFLAFLDWK